MSDATTYLDNEPITMEPGQAKRFWTRWAGSNPGASPLLTSLLPRWSQIVPVGEEEPLAWEDGEMENPEDPVQIEEAMVRLEDAMEDCLNRAAFNRLLELTVDPNTGAAEELTLFELQELIKKTSDPLARIALVEQTPYRCFTQIGWLAAWWVQDPAPAALPAPGWVTTRYLTWPAPAWDPREAPRPTWLMEWGALWLSARREAELRA